MLASVAPRSEPRLIGRTDLLAEARRLLHEEGASRSPVLLVVGATGIGKSTFVREVVREERERGTLVLEGRALPMDLPPPYFVLQEALRELPAVRRQAEEADRGAANIGVAGIGILRGSDRSGRSLMPLGMLPFESESESAKDREARLLEALSGDEPSVEEGRMELFDGLASHLEDVAAESPLLLVLEDLHHADEGSLEFLSFLARRGRQASLAVLVTSVPEAELPPQVRAHLEGLAKDGVLRRVALRPLTEAEATEFVEVLAPGKNVPGATLTKWYTLTEGNPLFLEQLVRGEVLSPGSTEGAPREVDLGELPRGEELRQALRRRLREMKEPERRALSYASVLGKEFSFPTLHRACGEEEELLAEAVESLVRRGLLREKGGEHLEFVHEELRVEVYTSLTEVRRNILHRKVAEALEKDLPREGSPDPRVVYELARHWYLAQSDEKALEYNRRAAELGKKALSPTTAAYHLERALEVHRRVRPHDRSGEVSLAVELALQLDAVGEVPRASAVLEEMRVQAHRTREGFAPRDRARLAIHLAKILTHAGEMQRAYPLTNEALEALGKEGEPQLLGHAHRLRGTVEFYRGHYPEAEQEYARSQEFFEKAESPMDVARSKISLANVRSMKRPSPPVKEVEALYRGSIEDLEANGQPGEAATASNNLALFYLEQVGVEKAMEEMARALHLAQKGKDPRMLGWCEFNMADLKLRTRELDEAERLNRQAREHLGKVGDRIALIQVALNEGRLFQARGDFPHAELALLDAYRQAREVSLEPDELEVLLRLCELSLEKGELESTAQKVAELEGRSFRSVRPDMAPELEKVREALKSRGVALPSVSSSPGSEPVQAHEGSGT
ncbi:MAG: AAA family ATPase [Euryarchaeota archaeon]|nr:AAA family ATPase [Euryarchaeota archaeon]MDE1879638.1 AAA family ATPase [Euryarchaeota archaeon]MDE2043831.1 AAA family ATPase [Thermoplasmata archaeon]